MILLAQIDPRPYQAQLDQATANRDRDQAQIVNAQTNLNRYVPLAGEGLRHRPTGRYPESPGRPTGGDGERRRGRNRERKGQSELHAAHRADRRRPPASDRSMRAISSTRPDANGLVDVTQIQPISLIFTLPETTFVEIQQEMNKGPVKVFAYSQGRQDPGSDEGELLLIDNQINQTTGTIRLRATFPNAKAPAVARRTRQCTAAAQDRAARADDCRKRRTAGTERALCLCDRRRSVGATTAGQGCADQRGTGADRFRPSQQRTGGGRTGQYKLEPGTHVKVLTGKAADEANMQSAVEQAIP